MKKLIYLFVFICLLLTSCETSRTMFLSTSGYLDYSIYSNEGFFITESNSVIFDYDPLGSISVYQREGSILVNEKEIKQNSEIYGSTSTYKKIWEFKKIDLSEMLEIAVEDSKKLGADALINLKIEPSPELINKTYYSGYILSGMAIKRK